MSDFVLILLVKGRVRFTERWLEYMAKINFRHQISIGNGEKKNNSHLKKLIKKKKYSKLNITYYSYNNQSYKDYYFMMYDMVKKQKKSRFIKFCDNDDFILPGQLDKLIKNIKLDKKCISVGDRAMWFSLIGKIFYNKNIYFWPDNFYRLNENFNVKNIKEVFVDFQESFYNIFKKKFILQTLKEICEINFSDLEIRDFYMKLRIMMFGQTKFYNQISYVRQHGVSQTSTGDFLYTRNFINKDISSDVSKLKKNIFKKTKNKSLNKNMIMKEIEEGYISYLNNVITHNIRHLNNKKIFQFKEFLKKRFKFLFLFIRKVQYLKSNLLVNRNYYEDYSEFKKELQVVKKFLRN